MDVYSRGDKKELARRMTSSYRIYDWIAASSAISIISLNVV